MNSDGKKLSKRHDHLRVSSLRTSGYSPEALLTFLCSIGGGILPRQRREYAVHSLESLVDAFYLENLTKAAGNLNFDFLNHYSRSEFGYYKEFRISDESASKRSSEKFVLLCYIMFILHFPSLCRSHLQALMATFSGQDRVLRSFKDCLVETREDHSSLVLEDDDELTRVIRWSLDRIHTVKDLVHDPDLQFVWRKPRLDLGSISDSLEKAKVTVDELTQLLGRVDTAIRDNRDLTKLNGELKTLTKKESNPLLPFKELMRVTRWCLIGETVGPPVFEIIDIIGKERGLERLILAVDFLKTQGASKNEKCAEA